MICDLNPCSQPQINALNYTGFPGLVQVAAENECGASLTRTQEVHSSQLSASYRDLGESAVEGGYT